MDSALVQVPSRLYDLRLKSYVGGNGFEELLIECNGISEAYLVGLRKSSFGRWDSEEKADSWELVSSRQEICSNSPQNLYQPFQRKLSINQKTIRATISDIGMANVGSHYKHAHLRPM